ncbi:HTR-like protein [Halorubrum distributum JCM 9100]|uniref:HTR-like protein n=3 Tax=Halorubrum distributum TaxID=29283 RepID=M0EMK2_9EURY|nr:MULTISPECIES: PAS domain S-box protein [Halorubrum distributum group]ELZ48333.1 HTR-like protein [Halorubrum distributum JCM 9100]ELZ55684.1 HTR-like protein [Halorubrum distributum JCM 10118]MDV7350964.1 PAS domain S-box protein [Halorubrum distributum]MYL16288.1 PAS domain S-box protein [Halorubrum terrestre]MYL68098.1 PAS domain S-box protein [Halorubrum terrestre]
MSEPPVDSGSEDASTVRVLHVDDDPDYLDLTATYLERIDEAFEVSSETDVGDALDALETEPIDCVVSDYDMPGTDGLTLLQRVRDRGIEVPFVLFTGKGSEEIASEAISAGATDYIQKVGGNDQYEVLANRVRNAVDQHRSRVALAASQERLSRFIDQSPLGTIEYDADFRIVRVNPAAEEILGYDESELLGGTWLPFVPEPEHRHVAALERDLLSDKGGYQSVNENVRSDGERIRCAWHNQVVTDAEGAVIGVFSQFEDVTEAEARKREIERSNAVLSTALDALPVGMLVEDADRRVIRVNERLYELFGVEGDPEAAAGRDCEALAAELSERFADPEGFVERIERIVGSRRPIDGERLALADGDTLILTYRPIDLPDGDGHLWAYRRARSSERAD